MGTHPIFESDFDCLTDGLMPLRKAERERCWEARDAYFQCLDEHCVPHLYIDNDKKELVSNCDLSICDILKATYDQQCPHTWRDHFSKIWNSKVYAELVSREQCNS